MTRPTPEQKVKIVEAMTYCNNVLKHLCEQLEKELGEKQSAPLIELIQTKAFFAGGLFRSIFTGTPVNDVDMWFVNRHSALEFQALVIKTPKSENVFRHYNQHVIGQINPLENHATIGFNLTFACNPEYLIDTFDFTCNQHFYRPFDNTFVFDKRTFNKEAHIVMTYGHPEKSLTRFIRFVKEGWSFREDTLTTLITQVANSDRPVARKSNDATRRLLLASAQESIAGNGSSIFTKLNLRSTSTDRHYDIIRPKDFSAPDTVSGTAERVGAVTTQTVQQDIGNYGTAIGPTAYVWHHLDALTGQLVNATPTPAPVTTAEADLDNLHWTATTDLFR